MASLVLQPRGGLMQDTDNISICHRRWTLLPIPHLLGDIIKTESFYRLFLFCPETSISLQLDTITLNISWPQRVTGMNFSPGPHGLSYLCVPPSWLLSTTQPKAFSTAAIGCYGGAVDCISKAGLKSKSNLVIQVKIGHFRD